MNIRTWLEHIQHDLFNIGSELSITDLSQWVNLKKINEEEVVILENCIDHLQKDLTPLENFILPGGSSLTAYFHVCRTVCRRSEIAVLEIDNESQIRPEILKYLNRLSDFMFVAARYSIKLCNGNEVLWKPTNGLATIKQL